MSGRIKQLRPTWLVAAGLALMLLITVGLLVNMADAMPSGEERGRWVRSFDGDGSCKDLYGDGWECVVWRLVGTAQQTDPCCLQSQDIGSLSYSTCLERGQPHP